MESWLVPSFLKPYLHGDILPGKFLKIEQAIEKSSCKSEIFLCHIVRPLTQLPCLGIERGLFSQESGTLQGNLSGMLMAFAYIFVDLLEGKGESPRVFCVTRKVIHQLLFTWSWYLLAKVLVYFASPRKPFIKFLLNKKYTCLRVKPALAGVLLATTGVKVPWSLKW